MRIWSGIRIGWQRSRLSSRLTIPLGNSLWTVCLAGEWCVRIAEIQTFKTKNDPWIVNKSPCGYFWLGFLLLLFPLTNMLSATIQEICPKPRNQSTNLRKSTKCHRYTRVSAFPLCRRSPAFLKVWNPVWNIYFIFGRRPAFIDKPLVIFEAKLCAKVKQLELRDHFLFFASSNLFPKLWLEILGQKDWKTTESWSKSWGRETTTHSSFFPSLLSSFTFTFCRSLFILCLLSSGPGRFWKWILWWFEILFSLVLLSLLQAIFSKLF